MMRNIHQAQAQIQSQYLEATAEALSISSHGTSLGNI